MKEIALHRAVAIPALLWLAVAALGSGGCMPDSLLITPVTSSRSLTETVIRRESAWTADKIVVVDVAGMLLNAHTPKLIGEGEHSVARLLEELDKARHDPGVKAVILRINSPGGTVTASELMHQEITRFREKSGKPVYAVMMDVAASGAYYLSCACERIYAQESTVTGSIGVIMQMFNLTETLDKLGIHAEAITSGPNKAAGSPFEPMTAEQRAIFQTMVDSFYDTFVEVVAAGRPELDQARVREIADGRVYTAQQALDLKLIDRIGSMSDAIADAKARTGIDKILLVRYHRPTGYVANYHAATPSEAIEVNLLKLDTPSLMQLTTPQFLYLWTGGN
jgi:protease-4